MHPHSSSKSDARKTKQRLIDELNQLRRQIDTLREATATSGTQVSVPPQASKRAMSSPDEIQSISSQLIKIAADAIISVDQTGQVWLFNQGAEQIFGYRADEVIGKSLDIFIPEEFRGSHKNYMEQFSRESVASRRMNDRQEISGRRKDGTIFPASATISRTSAAAGTILTVYLRDLSPVKELEEAGREFQEQLAHLNRTRMLGEISASLAHEVNQPLAAILANSQLLRRQLASMPVNDESTDEIIVDIISDAKRAGSIIEQIRGHVRPRKHEYETLDLNQAVADVMEMMHSEILIQHVAFELNLAKGLPAVFGDRIQLQQVILNCLSNAIDAMVSNATNNRRLIIGTRVASPTGVEISIKDNGAGLGKQPSAQLFEPFFTTKEFGMGMGLAISKTIVHAHGGRFWAERNKDVGATFNVVLPATKTKAEYRELERRPYSPLAVEQISSATVFIVEDDRSLCSAYARIVRAAGYAAETFSTARDFLQRKPIVEIGCLLLDLNLPGESGLDLQAKLATFDYAPPIIFLTGAGDTESSVKAMKLGAIDFLCKPVDEQELLDAINRGIQSDVEGRELYTRQRVAIETVATLTKREREVFNLVVTGLPNKRIASVLGISEKTVKAHRGRVMRKTEVRSVAELVRLSELAIDAPQLHRDL